MDQQLIISIGREFGSGGHEVAELLARRFDIPLYDNNLLHEIATHKNVNVNNLKKYDERPRNFLFSRSVQGYSNSPEENIARIQFDYLRRKADDGESFVIVGRCAEEILSGYGCMVSVFILGDLPKKLERVSQKYGVTPSEARGMLLLNDKKRKVYHNYYCKGKWGDSRNYELSINSSRIGVEKTADLIAAYISEKYGREL